MSEENLITLWNSILDELKPTVSDGNFNTILKPTALLSLEDDIATIAAASQMIAGLLQSRFQMKIKESLKIQTKRDVDILFVVRNIPTKQIKQTKKDQGAPLFEQSSSEKEIKPYAGHLPRVRPDFIFTNFAVSSTNQLAFVSAQRVAEKIGQEYNPLFIYGPVGVGKTHLMHAIANTVYQKNPEKKTIYLTSEEFTNEVVEAIRNNDTARMKKKFRSAYLLIIDDIQFIEGKERVQEELFHTFNILIDNGAQICLTSDRPPQEIKKLEKRLSSRFAGGLTVDIGKPDLELKTAILQKKAEKAGFELPIEVALFLAEQAEDTRSLEGLLLRVTTQVQTRTSGITLDLAKQAVGATVIERKQQLHPDDIINYTCDYFHVKPTQLKGPKRDAFLVKARQICMYLLYTELGLTYMDIGNMLGGRDHTTIMHGVDKIKKNVDNKGVVHGDILGITKYLRG
ncbi:MAG TPA: chromosomal replication initiator protein DnaA [Patescibacteria group bacterium]|nr:chromosomal replication initiator protein DnaA [Patescibacteria group bacterium]